MVSDNGLFPVKGAQLQPVSLQNEHAQGSSPRTGLRSDSFVNFAVRLTRRVPATVATQLDPGIGVAGGRASIAFLRRAPSAFRGHCT